MKKGWCSNISVVINLHHEKLCTFDSNEFWENANFNEQVLWNLKKKKIKRQFRVLEYFFLQTKHLMELL